MVLIVWCREHLQPIVCWQESLSENGVRFVQLYHQGWDGHDNLPGEMKGQCKDADQASAALITDLKQRGLLDETLVIWGGEFGRTNYCQG